MSSEASSTPAGNGPRGLSAVLAEVRSTGAVLAAAEVARTRALAEAGHLALDVLADQRAPARAAQLALREVASELAAAENLSDRSVQRQMCQAMTLVDDYPATLAAWEAGALTRAHAHVIADIGSALPPEKKAEFDLLAVATAEGRSPARLRSRLAVLAEKLHPTTLTERHQRGRDTRCVRLVTQADGMSDLIATLPTVLAVGIYDRLTHQARALLDIRAGGAFGLDGGDGAVAGVDTPGDDAGGTAAPGPHPVFGSDHSAAAAALSPATMLATDQRTTAQLRADILADLLLAAAPEADPTRTDDGPGTLGTIRARVQIVVPALTILNPTRDIDDPAALIAHGPIDAHTARTLAETTPTPWDRVLTHPLTGAVLHTDTYHRTTAIDRHLRARDRHCRWPGCTIPAIRCEVDHTHDHAKGGPTTITNLAHLCQRHHTQKQFTRWQVRQLPGGILEWTSPTGRTYTDEPLPYSPAVRFTPDDPPPPDPDDNGTPPPF
ncbi:HNH endonuclease [Microbacterium sp. JC 701]|uniref:HNH endonuclease n=1 Tax=Microbacterium sp. JC 701 TaxID=2897389 RepID=UPI001E292FE2|nr:HNH endonuclease signature motif containing protein [Microbacterium sp. JC 701]MCD2171103.1 HNH endonuclease [Microbacterium sp. JC 701]